MYKTVKPFAAAARSVKFVSKSQNFLVYPKTTCVPMLHILPLIYEEGT